MGGMMKEKQGLLREEGAIGLAGMRIVEKLIGWWRLLGKKVSERMEVERSGELGEGEESMEKAMGVWNGKSRWGVIHLVPLKEVEERGEDEEKRG